MTNQHGGELSAAPSPISYASKEFDSSIYNDVAKNADLVDCRMIDCKFSVQPEFYKKRDAAELKFSFDGKPRNPTFLEDEGVAAATFYWSANASYSRKKLLKVSAQFLLMYDGLIDMPPNYAITYVYKVGRFTSYPYFRSVVSTMCANAQADMPLLPSLKERVD